MRAPAVGLALPGRSGNYASTPNTGALTITGDLILVANVSVPRHENTVGSTGALVGRWNAAYLLSLTDTGVFRLFWRESGGGALNSSSVAIPTEARLSVASVLDVDNGAAGHSVSFWTSTDQMVWTQLGATNISAGVTDIGSGGDPLTMGTRSTGTSTILGGPTATIYRAQVFNGSAFDASGPGGTPVFDADFSRQTPGVSSFAESVSGAIVTINASADAPRAKITGRSGA